MTGPDQPRKPAVFRLDDSRLGPLETAMPEVAPVDAPPEELPGTTSALRAMIGWRRGIGWGGIFVSALSGLISLALGIWAYNFIIDLFTSGGWLGYVALGFAVVAAFAALMIAGRELLGYMRLGRVAAIRLKADSAIADANKAQATDASRSIESLFSDRPELKWGARRLADHRREVLDARELLILTEREMLRPLDIQAKGIIAATVRRVALITAISPSAIIDVAFVAYANLAMMRRLATLYGGRPGFLGSLRLARLVLGHLAVTGGVALGDDLIQQFIGHGLTARLSAKLGEGVMNGAFTGRIGIAAVDLCRPLPYIEAERPRLRDFLAEIRLRGKDQTTPAAPVRDE